MADIKNDKKDKKLIIDYNNIYGAIINSTNFKEKISACEKIIDKKQIDYYFGKIYENPKNNIVNNPKQFEKKHKYAEIRDMKPFYDPDNEDDDDTKYTKAYQVSLWYRISKDKIISELVYAIITITWWNKELLESKSKAIIARTMRNLKARLVAEFLIERLSNKYDNSLENERPSWWNIIWEFNSTAIVYIVDKDKWPNKVLLKSLDYFINYYLGKYYKDNIYYDVLFHKQVNQLYKWLWTINVYKAKSKLERDAIIWVLSYQNDYKHKYILSNDKDFYRFMFEKEDKAVKLINISQDKRMWVDIIGIKEAYTNFYSDKKHTGWNNQINEKVLSNLINPINTRLYYLVDKYFIWFKNWDTFSDYISENIAPYHIEKLVNYATIKNELEDMIKRDGALVWYSYSTPEWNFIKNITIKVDKNKEDELKRILKILPTSNFVKDFPLSKVWVDKEKILKDYSKKWKQVKSPVKHIQNNISNQIQWLNMW